MEWKLRKHDNLNIIFVLIISNRKHFESVY